MKTNEEFIFRCIDLAKKAVGKVSPNPLVGSVIVCNDEIIGEGWHREFGKQHAEVEAIRSAGRDSFEDCTLYVNLEPCSHYGKTPPCADLIIEKKFKKVVIGMLDPNPLVAGKGAEKLIEAGIEVISGVAEEECRWLNRTFIKYITENKPYVIAKVGQSIDSNIALKSGTSIWITGEESRKEVHRMRAEFDAVMIGRVTALNDDPLLNVREVEGNDPWRIVLDTNLKLPLEMKIFKENIRENTILVCNTDVIKSRKADLLRMGRVKLLPVNIGKGGIDLDEMLYKLAEEYKIASIMLEGGQKLLSSFVEEELIDEFHTFVAPMIIGGGMHAFDNFSIMKLENARRFVFKSFEKSGEDLHIIYTKK